MENKLTFDIEADELDIFLDEVNEHMQVMESGILKMEGEIDPDLVNSVFRAAHTIKALAGTVGHRPMAELTHTMENLFDTMRTDHVLPTQETIDQLLDAVDVLKVFRTEIETCQASGVDVTAILNSLRAITDGGLAQTGNGASKTNAKTGAAHLLTPQQAAELQAAQKEGQPAFEVNISTAADTFAPAARLMQAAMAVEEAGTIVAQKPSLGELANSEHTGTLWAVVIAPDKTRQDIESLLADVSDLAGFEVQPFEMTAPEPPAKKSPKADKPAKPKSNGGPEKTVRISVERLDALMNLVGELVTNRNRLVRVEDELRALYGKEGVVGELNETSTHMGRVVDQLQEEVMHARMLPISNQFDKFPRIVRDVARNAGKQVELIIEGGATELDRSLIEAIGDPLIHLLRNAVDHGIEPPEERVAAGKPPTGTVHLTAAHVEGQIVISITDDGRGINPDKVRKAAVSRGLMTEEQAAQLSDSEAIDIIFEPNLSTAEKLTNVSGRGVGMDVVRTNVERLSGAVLVESELGKGTTFKVTLPLTLAIVDTMLVQLWNAVYAIPLTSINDVLYLSEVETSTITGQPAIRWRGTVLPLIGLREFFTDARLPEVPLNGSRQAIVSVTWGKQKSGLVVDKIIGKQGIVVKSLSPIMGEIAGVSGGTILGDGRIALILDIPGLMNAALKARRGSLN
ncbi:MAG: chemotaxis protein CheA [Chloroflexi bacterium]|nr:MAG: chemotaxis protein CheA [Chloroflexota bacterium]